MARKIKNPNGQKADKKISLTVTADFFDNVKALAELTNGGNVNDLIVGFMDGVIKKNSAVISELERARKVYKNTAEKLSAEIDKDSDLDLDSPVLLKEEKPVAQDSTDNTEKSVGSDDK